MGLLSRMKAAIFPGKGRSRVRMVRGGYDAAQTTADNRNWWANADATSAAKANSPDVRNKLRKRARYEVGNNCYAGGIVRTIAEEAIGSGPRLQLPGLTRKESNFVEREWAAWAEAMGLTDDLLTMRRARSVDGETVGIMIRNKQLPTPVKLDLRLVEADQLCSPTMGGTAAPNALGDGIDYDSADNPVRYHILRDHPGDGFGMNWDQYDASRVIHDFRCERPGQLRGIPEVTPALPLFHLLRAYTLATLGAAESIANFAAVAYTDGVGDDGADDWPEFEELELARNMLTNLPRGWKLGQIKPEQPASTYREFKREIVGEIGRIFSMPYIVAAGDSSDANYASGRMDYQVWYRSIDVDRRHIEIVTLDRLFAEWVREATLIEGYFPQSLRTDKTDWRHVWMWPGRPHVDPQKEANAQDTHLANQTTNLAIECARQGLDWEEVLEKAALVEKRKLELAEKHGITWPTANPIPVVDDDESEKDKDLDASYDLVRDATGNLTGMRRAAS